LENEQVGFDVAEAIGWRFAFRGVPDCGHLGEDVRIMTG
jgi:hypothetical protein